MGLLEAQRAFITGGASGIGRATARMMAAEGARVAVADINGDGAKEVAAEMTALSAEDLERLLDPRAMTEGGIFK